MREHGVWSAASAGVRPRSNAGFQAGIHRKPQAAPPGRRPYLLALWVWATAGWTERKPQIGDDRRRFALQLPPGHAHRPVALGEEDAVAAAIRLEVAGRSV